MAMLAGYGVFLMETVLPRVQTRRSVLSVARMAMTWDAGALRGELERLKIDYDAAVLEKIRAQGHHFSTQEFFQLLGFESYDDIDIDASEGVSIVHDLNIPSPASLHNRYDLVSENGTIEHLFDIKTAMGNIAHMVKVGGHVCHGSPLDAFNHGFYNLSINFFNDFYRANGFTDLEFFLIRYATNWHENQNVMVERVEWTHEEFYINPEIYQQPLNKFYVSCTARKEKHVEPTVTPIQAAYDPRLGLDSRLTR